MAVFKIGGSLLDLPDLPAVVGQITAQRPGHVALYVVGGGGAADIVRQWDRLHQLGDERAHRLALAAMSLNAQLLAELMPGLRLVRSPSQVAAAARDRSPALLCAECFVPAAEAAGAPRLPRTWLVTSDAIAAWAASHLRADELVLLKSLDLPDGITPAGAAESGMTDRWFPVLAKDLPTLGWVNARADQPVICRWDRRRP